MVPVHLDVAPADDALSLGFDGVLEQLLELTAPRPVVRHEADGDPV